MYNPTSGLLRSDFDGTIGMEQRALGTGALQPEPEELRALAEDVAYEVQMFWVASHEYAKMKKLEEERPFNPMEQCVSNAWAEVHWLHLRNLLDFFASEPRRDDVVAAHYVPGWSRRDGAEALTDLEALRSRCNKHLQHLSAARKRRGRVADPPETTEFTVTKMKVLTDVFFTRLDPDRMTWFAPHIDKAAEVSSFMLPE